MKVIEAHYEKDEHKFKSYAEFIAEAYNEMGEEMAERIIRSRIDDSYKDKPKVTITEQEIKQMTKEELEREYYGRRPTEPYSEDDSPNDWANIVQYAEENLDKAFKAIAELEKENAELNEKLGDKVMQKQKDKADLVWKLKTANEQKASQLTKAKEIIKDYLTIVKGDHTTVCGVPEENRTINVLQLNEEAEKFIKR